MSPEILVPLLLLGGIGLMFVLLVVVWRLFVRDLYPNCTCWICGKRRRSAYRAKRGHR